MLAARIWGLAKYFHPVVIACQRGRGFTRSLQQGASVETLRDFDLDFHTGPYEVVCASSNQNTLHPRARASAGRSKMVHAIPARHHCWIPRHRKLPDSGAALRKTQVGDSACMTPTVCSASSSARTTLLAIHAGCSGKRPGPETAVRSFPCAACARPVAPVRAGSRPKWPQACWNSTSIVLFWRSMPDSTRAQRGHATRYRCADQRVASSSACA